jgi:hypothetical protein
MKKRREVRREKKLKSPNHSTDSSRKKKHNKEGR